MTCLIDQRSLDIINGVEKVYTTENLSNDEYNANRITVSEPAPTSIANAFNDLDKHEFFDINEFLDMCRKVYTNISLEITKKRIEGVLSFKMIPISSNSFITHIIRYETKDEYCKRKNREIYNTGKRLKEINDAIKILNSTDIDKDNLKELLHKMIDKNIECDKDID